jgi:hypothetical protein
VSIACAAEMIAFCCPLAKEISHAKAQSRKENLQKRGSALRLCAFA